MACVFTKSVFGSLTVNPGSDDEGGGDDDGNEPNKKKKKKIQLHVQRAFLYNMYEHDRKFPFATLLGGR